MGGTLEKPQNSWETFNLTTPEAVIKLLRELNATSHQIPSENVIKFKFIVGKNFEELKRKHLKTLELRFKFKTIVILVAANYETEFHIYWKSKDINQFLTLKNYNNNLNSNDKFLYEYVANFLVKQLRNGHLGTDINFDIAKNKYEAELHHIMDSRRYNLLLNASESGIVRPIETFLKYGLESQLPEKKVTAQTLALQGGFSDVLLKQLQGNLPFPPNMDISKCSTELKKFINMSEDVHKLIKSRNLDSLSQILSEHPKLKFFYNLQNDSALKTAVTNGAFQIYKSMIERNYSFAPHEDTDEIFATLNTNDREDLHKIHMQCCKDLPEKHINILIHNTIVTHDETDEHAKLDLVRRAYNALNKDPQLKIILKIVAAVKKFHIVFDFCRDSTFTIDPTSSTSSTGIYYSSGGRILIAAKQLLNERTENETFGALAHELCHFAIHEVYDNKSNPFRKGDLAAERKFKEILENCRKIKDRDIIIKNVYDCYLAKDQPSELIVRPAHLIAMYLHQPPILKQKMIIYKELFDFFKNVIIPAMERALPMIDAKLAYMPAYTFDGLPDEKKIEVKNAIVLYKNIKVKLCDLFPENPDLYKKLTSNHISQLLNKKAPIKLLNFNDPHLKYLEDQINFKWQTLSKKLKDEVLNSNFNFQGQILKFGDLDKSCSIAFDSLTSNQIISILGKSRMKIGEELKIENQFYVEREFIPEDAKLLDFEYQYGSNYKDIYEKREQHTKQRTKNKTLETFSREFMKKNFDQISQIFDEARRNSVFKTCYFNLCQEGYSFMHKSLTELIELGKKDKILNLSSEAGAGKTTTFEKLAKECKENSKTLWVSYIDLNSFTKLYKTEGNSINVMELLERIFGLNSVKNNFEVEIFRRLFESGNCVLVWNGFDEISPTYSTFIMSVLKYIRNHTQNTQFVCTRPLYSNQLSQAFKVRSWQLLPFDDVKKREFLKNYFIFQKVPDDKIEVYMKNVEKIIDLLNFEDISFAYAFNSPLMLKLLADIHENQNLFENAQIYGIFNAYIHKKIQIWMQRSTTSFPLATKLIINGNLMKFLQKYALINELRIFASTNLALKIRKLQIMQIDFPEDFPIEELVRLGILYLNGKNEFQFSHKTLSEFLVAQYFIENIYEAVDVGNEAELRLELFFHLTYTYGNLQKIITDFIASYLKMKNTNVTKKFHPIISHLLKTKFNNFFFRMLDTNHPEVFEFLFEFFKKDHQVLVNLLHIDKDETFYTAFFNPNHFALTSNPEKIQSIAKKYLTDNEFVEFTNGKNQKGKILLGTQFYKNLNNLNPEHFKSSSYWKFFKKHFGPSRNSFFKKLLKKSEDLKLTELEQQEVLMTALSPKIYLFYSKLFKDSDFKEYKSLWDRYEKLLPTEKISNILGDFLVHFFEVCGYEVKGHEMFLNLLLEKVEKFLTKTQIFEIFMNKSILHGAHWHQASFIKLWDFLKNHTSKQERKQILEKYNNSDNHFYFYTSRNDIKNDYSNNQYSYVYYDFTPFKLFHRLIINNFSFTIEIYENHLSESEIRTLILNSNEFLYYMIKTANEGNNGSCEQLASYLVKLFKGRERELKEFLNRKITNTNLSVFEYIELFKGLPHSQPKWFNNLSSFERINKK